MTTEPVSDQPKRKVKNFALLSNRAGAAFLTPAGLLVAVFVIRLHEIIVGVVKESGADAVSEISLGRLAQYDLVQRVVGEKPVVGVRIDAAKDIAACIIIVGTDERGWA